MYTVENVSSRDWLKKKSNERMKSNPILYLNTAINQLSIL